MSATATVKCKCSSEFQDKRYGVGNRIANATVKRSDSRTTVRCTVCKALHEVNNSQVRK